MKGSNLKSFAIGAIIAAGLGVAVTLPAPFAAGEALSATKLNQYFTAIKTAIDALEADGSVNTAKIADNAVTGVKIVDGAVGTADIADGAVGTADIADGAVGNADLAANAVNGAKIADGTVATADLADSAVNGTKIADGTVANADFGNNVLTASKTLDEPGVKSADLADANLTAVFSNIGSVTLNAPAPGFVIVTATLSARVLHINAIKDTGIFQIGTQSGVFDNSTANFVAVSVPASFPTAANNTDFHITPVTVRRVFPVNAGNNTFFLNGQLPNGTVMLAVSPVMTAVYVPTQY